MAQESVARISTKAAVVGAGLLGIRIAGKPDNALRLGEPDIDPKVSPTLQMVIIIRLRYSAKCLGGY